MINAEKPESVDRYKMVQASRDALGTYRDHRVTGALNFHKIRDFCILVMVLDV